MSIMNKIFTIIFSFAALVTIAQNGEFHLDKAYKINKNGTIDLSSSDAKVFITGSLRQDAHVKIDRTVVTKGAGSSRSEFKVEVESTDGNLQIRERSSEFSSGFITYIKEDYRIEIEAPEGVSLTIRGDDGDYYIKNINGTIFMSLDDADAELAGCKGDSFTFRLDDGDIRMDRGKGSLDIRADDGDVRIYNAQFSSVKANVDDGDLLLETSLADNGEYRLGSQDGSIVLNITKGGGEFDIRHDDGSVSAHGNFKTNLESEAHTKMSLASGTAKVIVNANDARVKLSQVASTN
jgi:hypothetical protein